MQIPIKAKALDVVKRIKTVKLPAMSLSWTQKLAKSIEAKHLIYLAIVLLPTAVILGAYYGLMTSMDKIEAAGLPQNQLYRKGIPFTTEEFVKYAGRGERDIIDLFVEAGMPPDSYRQNDGFSPLIAAAAYGRTNTVKYLLDKGADINIRDKDGQTALMKAVLNNQADVVGLLLKKDANLAVSDVKGNSVVSMAKEKNDRKVLAVFAKSGLIEPISEKGLSGHEKQIDVKKSAPMIKFATSSNYVNVGKPADLLNAPPGEFTLSAGYAGALGVGQDVDSVYSQFGTQAVTVAKEYKNGISQPVLRVFTRAGGQPSLLVFVGKDKDGQSKDIGSIQVFDERYKIAEGVGVGSTLGDLRKINKISKIEYTDSLYAVSRDTHMLYELDISANSLPVAWLNGGDGNSLPDEMKIRSIILQ